MALDATVGGASANSYVTQATATTYFASGMHEGNATWTALDSAGKDEYLIKATLQIDMQRIRGEKYTRTLTSGVPDQRLKFPRTIDYDDGTTFIPYPIKQATYEQAIYLATVGDGADLRAQLQAQGVTEIKLYDVSEKYDEASVGSSNPLKLLAPIPRQILLTGGFIQRTATFTR